LVPRDDLVAASRPRGLPIGNLTSQFWANVHLSMLDDFIKRGLQCPAYLRYVDDFLLFSDSRDQLWGWREAVIEKLAGLRLTLHEQEADVFPCSTGIPLLGFRIYPEHRLVKSRKVIHYRRKLRRLLREVGDGLSDLPRLEASISGWKNHVRYADTWGLQKSVLGMP
jgi:hypothetical protein